MKKESNHNVVVNIKVCVVIFHSFNGLNYPELQRKCVSLPILSLPIVIEDDICLPAARVDQAAASVEIFYKK